MQMMPSRDYERVDAGIADNLRFVRCAIAEAEFLCRILGACASRRTNAGKRGIRGGFERGHKRTSCEDSGAEQAYRNFIHGWLGHWRGHNWRRHEFQRPRFIGRP